MYYLTKYMNCLFMHILDFNCKFIPFIKYFMLLKYIKADKDGNKLYFPQVHTSAAVVGWKF